MAGTRFDGDATSDKSAGESSTQPSQEPALSPDDFYYDGPYLVFTEEYHLRRGSCCRSGCRHCPYGFKGEPESA